MTREEAKEFLTFISHTLGNMSIEYLTEKDGEKMREAIKVLDQEPSLPSVILQQKDEDIAKAFQFGMALGFGKRYDEMDRVVDEIKKVTTPQPGHWVKENINEWSYKVFCSECGCPPPFEHVNNGDVYSASGYGVINKTKFCPNCGCRMVEIKESEDKDE